MKHFLGLQFTFFSALLLVACSPATRSPQAAGASPVAGTNPATPGAPVPTSNATGTISGGGGNGINGRVVESYSTTQIEGLSEYKHYVAPVLRDLSRGRSDILVAYLTWAAHSKAWYFVPVALDTLPKERLNLTFRSEQLARHSDQEIFIYEPEYRKKSAQERAWLLMHEMVMGAKLLMKKSPRLQCQVLSSGLQNYNCQDEQVLKSANTAAVRPDGQNSDLDGKDTENVRAMTVALMNSHDRLSASGLATLRSRLDFVFPWEATLSQVEGGAFSAAFNRTTISRELFSTDGNFATKSEADCTLETSSMTNEAIALKILISGAPQTDDHDLPPEMRLGYECPENKGCTQATATLSLSENSFTAVGVADPSGSHAMVDLVTFEPYHMRTSMMKFARLPWPQVPTYQFKLEFYISRETQPRILEYRVVPVTVLYSSNAYGALRQVDYESVETKNVKPIRCRIKQDAH